MTDVTIKVTCTASGGYRVRIDDELVELVGHKKTLDVKAGVRGLSWIMWGNQDETITIEANAKGSSILEIKDRKIPKNREQANGVKNMPVPS